MNRTRTLEKAKAGGHEGSRQMLINLTTSQIEDLKMEDLATEFGFLVALSRLRNALYGF